MRKSFYLRSLIIIPLLSGCSVIGAEIGEEVDRSALGDSEDRHKYEAQYMVEGLETDVEIIKAILTKPEEEPPYIVDNQCKEKDTVQVCSAKKGCWCEKYQRSVQKSTLTPHSGPRKNGAQIRVK